MKINAKGALDRARRTRVPGLAVDAVLLGLLAGAVVTLGGGPRAMLARGAGWQGGEAGESGRGRQAERPGDIPPRGWKDIAKRTYKEFKEDNIPLISAGVTFYALLALFPALGAFGALYGLFADVADAQRQIAGLSGVLPGDVVSFISDQMIMAAAANPAGLSAAFVIGLLISLWSANGAAKALFLALNIAYEEEEKRGFIRLTLTTLAFTAGGVLVISVVMLGMVAVSAVMAYFGAQAAFAASLLRWPVLALVTVGAVSAFYRYGPSRDRAKWRWVTWGSALVTLVWIAASIGFSLYLSHLAQFEKTYGPLGAAIAFMMWTYLSSVILLCGAELNAEMEHQTARDTTRGPAKPMGLRGAKMADTLGPAQP